MVHQLRENAPRQPSIWLVDDSPLQAEIARLAIASSYEVTVFSNGHDMIGALAGGQVTELLILDWHMPDMSGLEVCQFVRQTYDAGQLPILILTVNGAADSLVAALEGGANDFVMKPFSQRELQARVAALLRVRAIHTKLRETERQLRIEAEFRERFIGMLAHDLSQPLNTMMLANQTIEDAPEHVRVSLTEMQRRAAERMARMVEELLDFARSRPQSGMPVELESMDFGVLLSELVDEVRIANPSRVFQLDVSGQYWGKWDHDRLAQMCSNLLGNAIEHGAANAAVVIRVRRENSTLLFSVANEGLQIPTEALASLFQPFRRGPRAGRTGGVGLGLYIVSEIARAHGGTVEAVSDARATTFLVKLPIG